ncbi:hypothetical protein FOA52_013818 [Chlamydomonas sp. UWO 241]|nr:hypothetical protein FOA52_013818 [Chlamydomonas sp. UWO 241]
MFISKSFWTGQGGGAEAPLNWRPPPEVVTWFEDSCLGFGVFLGLISPRRLRQPTPEEEESVGDNDGKDKASMQRAPASVARSGLTSVAPSELGSEAPAKKRGLLRRIFKSKDKAPPYGPAGPIPSKPVFRLVGRRAAGSSPGPAPPSPPSSSTGTHATAAPANSASRPSVGFALDPSGPPTVGIALAPAKVPSVSVSLSPANTPRGR